MTYNIQITRSAEQDLSSAADYIAHVLLNPSAAYALLDAADEKFSALVNHPTMYATVDDPILKRWELRFIPLNNYLAFYTVSEASHTVSIVRFLYGKRDWINVLRSSLPVQYHLGEFT